MKLDLASLRSSLPPETIYTLDAITMAEGKAPSRIWIASVGTYYHPISGKFSLTADRIGQIVANFDTQVERGRTNPVPVDIDHATIRAPMNEDRQAMGFISALSFDGKSLWGDVTWTDKGSELVAGGGFRFTSPVIIFNHEDTKTGEKIGAVLHSVALTNQPILPDGVPVVASLDAVTSLKDFKAIGTGDPVVIVQFTGSGTEGADTDPSQDTPSTTTENTMEDSNKVEPKAPDDTDAIEDPTKTIADLQAKIVELEAEKVAAAESAKQSEVKAQEQVAAAAELSEGKILVASDVLDELKEGAKAGMEASKKLLENEAKARRTALVGIGGLTPAQAENGLIVQASESEDSWKNVIELHPEDSAWNSKGKKGEKTDRSDEVAASGEPDIQLLSVIDKTMAEKKVDYVEAQQLVIASHPDLAIKAGWIRGNQ